jgi:hypothetical protein
MEKAKTGAKDFFLWAGAMLFLYADLVAFITLLFGYIDYVFPNALNYYPTNPYDSGMSYQMAVLIVLVPAFLILMHFIRRDISANESRADIWVRKWALYLTLFVAGITVAADLITLLYYFLSGQDITVRFLLKVAVVALVGAALFMHFMADIWGYWLKFPNKARMVGAGAGILVVLTILAGFLIVGTPWQAREYRIDTQRVNDLQNIQWQIVNYWQQKQKLPASLADLGDSISGWNAPIDPKTGEAYTYKVVGDTSFDLCATFSNVSIGSDIGRNIAYPTEPYGAGISDNWSHGSGTICFSRTIDPERYPPVTKPIAK